MKVIKKSGIFATQFSHDKYKEVTVISNSIYRIMINGVEYDVSDGDWIIELTDAACLVLSDSEFKSEYEGLPVVNTDVKNWIEYIKKNNMTIADLITDYEIPTEVNKWIENYDASAGNPRSYELLVKAYLYGYVCSENDKYDYTDGVF